MSKFQFELSEEVKINISGDEGYIKGRAEYVEDSPGYLVCCKDAYGGLSFSTWLPASEISAK